MDDIAIWILTGISTVFFGIAGYFLRDLHMSFKSMKKDVSNLTIGLNMIQSELNNNTKEVAELKADLNNFKDNIDKRLDRQGNLSIENGKDIAVLKTKVENLER
jgi:peptidoglycan hydrolase CwlO-like protein